MRKFVLAHILICKKYLFIHNYFFPAKASVSATYLCSCIISVEAIWTLYTGIPSRGRSLYSFRLFLVCARSSLETTEKKVYIYAAGLHSIIWTLRGEKPFRFSFWSVPSVRNYNNNFAFKHTHLNTHKHISHNWWWLMPQYFCVCDCSFAISWKILGQCSLDGESYETFEWYCQSNLSRFLTVLENCLECKSQTCFL